MRWRTAAALSRRPLEPRQKVWICTDPECEMVYFGAEGLALGVDDVHVQPGFKSGSDGLVCYCFLHRAEAFVDERRGSGEVSLVEQLESAVAAGDCACEVRSPFGRCCLKDVRRLVESAGERRSDR